MSRFKFMESAPLLLIVVAGFLLNACGSARAQLQTPETGNPTGLALLSGQYTYWAEGQLWNQPSPDGKSTLPPGVPSSQSTTIYDSGTFDADGNGHATQCGGGAWGTWATPMNCTAIWTYEFGVSDKPGVSLNPRLGLIQSNIGDKATIACTVNGKHCVMTSHGVGWAWTQILDRE
jgi:hypothetical protein